MNIWQNIYDYYFEISTKYAVNPIVFISIHAVCTPLLILVIWWLLRTKKLGKPIIAPLLCAIVLYNIANVYLVIVGRNIPLYIYLMLILFTLYSGYISVSKIREKLADTKSACDDVSH
jgi:Na+/melibiose symporter-like transporter